MWFQKLSVVGAFVIEIAVPFLFFSPIRRHRLAAFYMQVSVYACVWSERKKLLRVCALLWRLCVQVLFQVFIILSGNYNFFNILTITLCLSLLDDQHVNFWLRRPTLKTESSRDKLTLHLHWALMLTRAAFKKKIITGTAVWIHFKCNLFCFCIITPVFSVAWFFINHYNMLICCSFKIHDIYLWKLCFQWECKYYMKMAMCAVPCYDKMLKPGPDVCVFFVFVFFFSIVTDSILWNGFNVRGQCIRPAWLLDSPILWPAGGLGKEKRVLQNRWSSQQCLTEVSYLSVWFISLCVPLSQPLLILSSMAFWRLLRCPVSGLVFCVSRGRSSLPCLSKCYGIVHLSMVYCWLDMSIRWRSGWTNVFDCLWCFRCACVRGVLWRLWSTIQWAVMAAAAVSMFAISLVSKHPVSVILVSLI